MAGTFCAYRFVLVSSVTSAVVVIVLCERGGRVEL